MGGGGNEDTVRNTVKHISDKVFEQAMTVHSTCSSNTKMSQELSINFDNTEVISNCYKSQTEIGSELDLGCASLKTKTLDIQDINQNMKVIISMECEFTNDMTQEIVDKTAAELDQTLVKKEDMIGKTARNLTDAFLGRSNKTTTENETTMHHMLKEIVSTELLNDCVSEIAMKQELVLDLKGGIDDVYVASINQDIISEVMMKAFFNNTTLQSALTETELTVDQSLEQAEQGIFSTLSDMFNMFGDNAMYVMLCSAICCCALVFISSVGAIIAINYKDVAEKAVNKMPSK